MEIPECPSDNSGRNFRRLPDSGPRIPLLEKCGKISAPVPEVKVGSLHKALILLMLLLDGHSDRRHADMLSYSY
jgi:hypothetical protein